MNNSHVDHVRGLGCLENFVKIRKSIQLCIRYYLNLAKRSAEISVAKNHVISLKGCAPRDKFAILSLPSFWADVLLLLRNSVERM